MIFSNKTHQYIYILGLSLLAIGLPTSVFLMSLSQFIIYGNWILEGQFKRKWQRFLNNKTLWLILTIYIIHLLWTIFPQDYLYALNDLRIKLPLLLFPFFVGTSNVLTKKELKFILLTFTSTVTVVSIVGLYRFVFKDYLGIIDYRNVVPFISHIRFSLMLVFSFFILLYFFTKEQSTNVFVRYTYFLNALFLGAILFILKINTGLFIFVVLIIMFLIYKLYTYKKSYIKWLFSLLLVFFIVWFAIKIFNIWGTFMHAYYLKPPREIVLNVNNKPFFFSSEAKDVENGNRVHFYIHEDELKKEWNLRSNYKYNGYDLKGNKIKYTLKRYLTSKNLTKDSFGISKLTESDIKAIEKGIANYIFNNPFSVHAFIYSYVWDFYNFYMLNKVNNSSLFQRIEYQKIALHIIKNNFWLGVGTGNVKQAFDEAYNKIPTNLSEIQRHRAHNQFLTFLLTFGIFGFLWFLFAFLYPFLSKQHLNNFLPIVFIIICLVSFLTEDTLETQAGVTFVIFFYSLFTLSTSHKDL